MNNNNEKKRKKKSTDENKVCLCCDVENFLENDEKMNNQPTNVQTYFHKHFPLFPFPFLHSRISMYFYSVTVSVHFFQWVFSWRYIFHLTIFQKSMIFYSPSLSFSLFCSPHLTHRLHITYICNHVCGMRKVYSIKNEVKHFFMCYYGSLKESFFSRVSIAFVPSLSNRTVFRSVPFSVCNKFAGGFAGSYNFSFICE